MNPLAILASLAVGTAVVAKVTKPSSPPAPPVNPEITNAGRHLAIGHMLRGASPEEAAARAADQLAQRGGGFWKDKRSSNGAVRF